jgi:hypothetical protein
MKVTQKQLKELQVKDITKLTNEEVLQLKKDEGGFFEVAYSIGEGGTNGLLLQGLKTKELYKLVGRTSTIFLLM